MSQTFDTGGAIPALRRVRSFVRREGRLTAGQWRALEQYWPQYGIDYKKEHLNFAKLYGRLASIDLEIGFGNGESLVQMANMQQERNFLGIEVHRPGVGHILQRINTEKIANLRVICHDAVEVLEQMIPPHSLARIQIFFPDPWPKKRHHKRRLLQPEFVALLASRLQPAGILHIATDWEDYATHILSVLAHNLSLQSMSEDEACSVIAKRPKTRFEQRGQRHGHQIWDYVYMRTG